MFQLQSSGQWETERPQGCRSMLPNIPELCGQNEQNLERKHIQVFLHCRLSDVGDQSGKLRRGPKYAGYMGMEATHNGRRGLEADWAEGTGEKEVVEDRKE